MAAETELKAKYFEDWCTLVLLPGLMTTICGGAAVAWVVSIMIGGAPWWLVFLSIPFFILAVVWGFATWISTKEKLWIKWNP